MSADELYAKRRVRRRRRCDALHRTFQRHGLVIVRGSPHRRRGRREPLRTIDDVVDALAWSASASGAAPASHVQHDDVQVPATLKQIQQLYKKDPFFERLMARLQALRRRPPLARAPPRRICSSSQSRRGRRTPARASRRRSRRRRTRMRTTSCSRRRRARRRGWVALDRVDEENGCFSRYLPRAPGARERSSSRRADAPERRLGHRKRFSQAITDWGADDERREVAVRARPGDLIVHQSLMVHRADANRSGERGESRCSRAVGAIFYADSHRVAPREVGGAAPARAAAAPKRTLFSRCWRGRTPANLPCRASCICFLRLAQGAALWARITRRASQELRIRSSP